MISVVCAGGGMALWRYFVHGLVCSASLGVSLNTDVRRIERHINFLSGCCAPCLFPSPTGVAGTSIFRHELVKWCERMLATSASLSVLEQAWHVFLASKYDANNEIFMREFSLLIFCVYHHFLEAYLKAYIPDVCVLYDRLSRLPLREILDILDMYLLHTHGVLSSLPATYRALLIRYLRIIMQGLRVHWLGGLFGAGVTWYLFVESRN